MSNWLYEAPLPREQIGPKVSATLILVIGSVMGLFTFQNGCFLMIAINKWGKSLLQIKRIALDFSDIYRISANSFPEKYPFLKVENVEIFI